MENILLYIFGVIFIISIIYLNNKIETFKKEKFEVSEERSHSSIDTVSVKNLTNLATNLISNNGKDLTLEYENIKLNSENGNIHLNTGENGNVSINAFENMIAPFYVDFNKTEQINKLKTRFWFLCDGQEGPNSELLPDLRGRFIWGGGPGSEEDNKGDSDNNTTIANNTGGELTHVLTIGEMPSHKHNYFDTHLSGRGGVCSGSYHTQRRLPYETEATGGGQPHNNMPPYMVMAYFIYLP